jgi:hypothetical protein
VNTDQKRPMSEAQLEYVKNEIKKTYLYQVGHTTYDPELIEVMKLAALADVQRRYEVGESWLFSALYRSILQP